LDDLTVFREGLIAAEQAALSQLSGLTVYHIDLQIADDFTLLQGREEVLYTNQEEHPLDEIYFRLFATTLGGFVTISGLQADGQDLEPIYEYQRSALRVPLSEPLLPGGQVLVQMDFEVKLPGSIERNYGVFGYFDDVLVLDSAYPAVAVYDDEGWNVETPLGGDMTYYDASFYLVRVTAPAGLTMVASGSEIDRQSEGDSQVVTFAAGPSRDFYLAASERYTVASATVGETTINSYTPVERAEAAEMALGFATAAMEVLNQLLGPYPYTECDIVSTPLQFKGVEYPGVVAMASIVYDLDQKILEGASLPLLESVLVHELAHQWFYNVVGNDQVDEPWLDEAMAQYVTGRYHLEVGGDEALQEWHNLLYSYWDLVERVENPINRPLREFDSPQEYRAIVYGRGPLFVEALAEQIGAGTFDAFLQDYASSHKWGIGTTETFMQLAEAHCNCDLSALFESWVYPPGAMPPRPAYEPVFEPTTCFTSEIRGLARDGYDLECGYLVVPEDRRQPQGKQVRMPVVVFHTKSSNPQPDPVIYLAGGGGFNVMPLLPWYMDPLGDYFLQKRDFIVYNQRGAPLGEPSLPCPGYGSLLNRLGLAGDLSREERMEEKIAFLVDCRDDLLERGINLEMYNSTTNAADANDLRIALGYEQANYYGVSYGTRVGLALIRDYPEGVRSIILDSVQPPQVAVNSERAPNAYRAFEKLFAACAADDNCSEAYPDLEATFYQVIDDLNANPVTTTVSGSEISYGGGVFSEAIYAMLTLGRIDSAPKAIYTAAEGDLRYIDPYIPDILNVGSPDGLDIISAGVFYSLACREEVPFDSYENAVALAADLPPSIADHYLFLFAVWQFSLCEAWGIEPGDPVVNEAVVSDVPALILMGQFDPITPPEYGQLTAENLSNSFFYEFPNEGHEVMMGHQCALGIGLQFLNDPAAEPDASCIEGLPGPNFK
jgi:pimeloyl-ACP methyl ester carboxylesterase